MKYLPHKIVRKLPARRPGDVSLTIKQVLIVVFVPSDIWMESTGE